MKTILLNDDNFLECVREAAAVLRADGVLIFPTDTLYGLGADAFSDVAVDTIYAIKGRDEKKPIHCIVTDMKMAEEYADMNDFARMLARDLLPGALTMILPARGGSAPGGKKYDTGIGRGLDTIGIRIPNNPFALALAREFGRPLTATSANRSGEVPERTIAGIVEQLGDAAVNIECAIDAGEMPERKPSTVVDLTGAHPVILREGAVPAMDIWEVLELEQD